MMNHLSAYSDYFEPAFLLSTKDYYIHYAQQLINEFKPNSIQNQGENTIIASRYIDWCHTSIVFEIAICNQIHQSYILPNTQSTLFVLVLASIVKDRMPTVLEYGFDGLFASNNKPQLLKMFQLISKLDEDDDAQIRQNLANFIIKTGTLIVQDKENDPEMVHRLISFKQSVESVVEECFEGRKPFLNCVKESFESFINTRQNKPAEMYCRLFLNPIITSLSYYFNVMKSSLTFNTATVISGLQSILML